MSEEIKSIHDFDVNLIVEYYANLERQGPGSPEITSKALSFIENIDEDSRIVDIGCGTGGQTMVLAENTNAKITGIDLFPRFIDLFNANAQKHNVHHRVVGKEESMDKLTLEEASIDLIWSEGAIYNIGFERGLNAWRKFLKKNGCIAVSEVSWLTSDPPKEIYDFWQDAYPEIDTIAKKVEQMQNAGYIPVASFVLPESCWTEHFYAPQVEAQKLFLAKYANDKAASAFIQNQQHEEQLYYKYKEHYGYVFFIGKKI